MVWHVAVDIGASSGRLVLGRIEEGKLTIREVHRFGNGFSFVNHHDRWNIDGLVREIFIGLEKVKAAGVEECVIGIDTWAVDYVLVGKNGEKIADPVCYRDARTVGAVEAFSEKIPKRTVYEKTGIQFLELNTLYQLCSENRALLDKTDKILLIPDYIGYVLTGMAFTEVTNASTTQMLNLAGKCLDGDILEAAGVPESKFAPLATPGRSLGKILKKWYDAYDLPEAEVVVVGTHDTASAVAGAPAFGDRDWAYLSSGTWSLIGLENKTPVNTEKAFVNNFTNEWGVCGTYRVLRNIMGLWMTQEVARLHDYAYSYADMAAMARTTPFFHSVVDVNDPRFNNPENMIEAIQRYCMETRQVIPQSVGELTNCIYSSLAVAYRDTLKTLKDISGKDIRHLYVVGGGSNIGVLNELTADLCGVTVHAGPSEATAIGNLCVQMISKREIRNINEARMLVAHSFDIAEYEARIGQNGKNQTEER